jgi:hypothetical protein
MYMVKTQLTLRCFFFGFYGVCVYLIVYRIDDDDATQLTVRRQKSERGRQRQEREREREEKEKEKEKKQRERARERDRKKERGGMYHGGV